MRDVSFCRVFSGVAIAALLTGTTGCESETKSRRPPVLTIARLTTESTSETPSQSDRSAFLKSLNPQEVMQLDAKTVTSLPPEELSLVVLQLGFPLRHLSVEQVHNLGPTPENPESTPILNDPELFARFVEDHKDFPIQHLTKEQVKILRRFLYLSKDLANRPGFPLQHLETFEIHRLSIAQIGAAIGNGEFPLSLLSESQIQTLKPEQIKFILKRKDFSVNRLSSHQVTLFNSEELAAALLREEEFAYHHLPEAKIKELPAESLAQIVVKNRFPVHFLNEDQVATLIELKDFPVGGLSTEQIHKLKDKAVLAYVSSPEGSIENLTPLQTKFFQGDDLVEYLKCPTQKDVRLPDSIQAQLGPDELAAAFENGRVHPPLGKGVSYLNPEHLAQYLKTSFGGPSRQVGAYKLENAVASDLFYLTDTQVASLDTELVNTAFYCSEQFPAQYLTAQQLETLNLNLLSQTAHFKDGYSSLKANTQKFSSIQLDTLLTRPEFPVAFLAKLQVQQLKFSQLIGMLKKSETGSKNLSGLPPFTFKLFDNTHYGLREKHLSPAEVQSRMNQRFRVLSQNLVPLIYLTYDQILDLGRNDVRKLSNQMVHNYGLEEILNGLSSETPSTPKEISYFEYFQKISTYVD